MPATLSTVNTIFRGSYRAAAFGIWGAVISGAAAIGPLAGGALTQWASWHWIFLVNIPLGLAVFAVAIFVMPETRGDSFQKGADVVGAVFSAVGFGALVFTVIEGPSLGWWSPAEEFTLFGWTWPTDAVISPIPISFVIAIAALVVFILWERRRGKQERSALLDLRLFSFRTFSWGNITAGMVAIGEFAIIFVLPLYLINALGLDVMGAGLVLAAMALGAFASGAAARQVAGRWGAPTTVLIGLGLEVLGVLALILLIQPDGPVVLLVIPLVVYGLGLGLASAQLTGTILYEVPVGQSGQGSATQSTVRQVGSALGTAFSGAVLSVALAITLPSALSGLNLPADQAKTLADNTRASAGTTILQLREGGAQGQLGDQTDAVMAALSSEFTDAIRWSLAISVTFLVLGLIGAQRLRRASQSSHPIDGMQASESVTS